MLINRNPAPIKMTLGRNIDVLTATAADARRLLEAGEISSVELVKLYLKQIAAHNHEGMKLNAMISIAAEDGLLEEAHKLDAERLESGPRSRLHGIPIILKDLICTPSFGLETTSGSFALKGLNATTDAPIAVMLREAGCIVLGKSNLSEWGNSKGVDITSGWSAVGGQTQSPYVQGGADPNDQWMGHTTPAGSSSGSAVAAAAGFAPLCIGTEADGSLVQPSIRAALYGMKGTVGDVNMVGTQSGSAAWDRAGPMAKCVEDCVDVMDILLPGRDFNSHLKRSWKGIGIAYLNYETWQFSNESCNRNAVFDKQHKAEMDEALKKAEALGAHVTYDAPLMTVPEVVEKYKTVQMWQIGRHQLAHTIARYLAIFDCPGMRTLQDVVEFNKKHADVELPPGKSNQLVLENGLQDSMTDEEYHSGLKHLRASMRDSVEKTLKKTNSDVIIASGDSLLPTAAAVAGYPIASAPLGFSNYKGRPTGIEIVARNGEEEKLFEVMSAWEATFPDGRKPPPPLVNWKSTL
ncbi:amidase signature domain-containing protein [Xylogone sp. PMI_703]|nr:amidase signature domain-containing protein [Xylogone sp. PMI_703]